MPSNFLSLTFVTLALSLGTYAGSGPVLDLPIVNLDIAPDGFTRPTVLEGPGISLGSRRPWGKASGWSPSRIRRRQARPGL